MPRKNVDNDAHNVHASTRARARRAPGGKVANAWRAPFLEALSETGVIAAAARVAGVSRRRAYDVYAEDAEFAAAWDQAIAASVESLEEVLMLRAHDTSDRDSARLLMFVLSARKPEVYGKQVRHAGVADGPPVKFKVTLAPERDPVE